MDTNKLSDVLELALNKNYIPSTRERVIGTGMCNAVHDLFIQGHINLGQFRMTRSYLSDFIDEMFMLTDNEGVFLYQYLISFEGYDLANLQYLIWETIIEKLRSQV